MKKLLFASMLCLFTTMVTGQVIITSTPYCHGTPATITANYYSTKRPAISHTWTFTECNASGNVGTNAPLFTCAPITGGTGNYVLPSTVQAAFPNKYALLSLAVTTQSNVYTYTSVIFFRSTNQPVMSSTTVCGPGGGTVCAVLAPNESPYNWIYTVNGNPYYDYSSGACLTLPANYNDWVYLNTINECGYIGTTSAIVHSINIESNFNVNISPINSMFFNATASPAISMVAGMTESWHMEEVTQTSSFPLTFATIDGTGAYNPGCWTSNPTTIFYGYDGNANSTYNDGNLNNCVSGSYFLVGRIYRVSRTVSYPGCSSHTTVKVFKSTGTQCSNCREGQTGDETTITNTISLDVFPNPSNGAFTVQLNESAENAQAELINLLGEKVDAFTFSGTSFSYSPAQTFAPGVYLLRVTNNGVVNSKRIVIE